jgi:hypothetical protein
MKELVRLRENQPELPIVVCGDMNSNRRSLVREYMLHGMPELRDGALPAQGPFSDVWMREFNKKQEKPKEGGGAIDWTDDCFPWQSLWFHNCPDDEPLLPSKNLVPLLDAYQDLHDGKLAYTVPGEKNERSENMVLDHMYAADLAHLQLRLAHTRFSFHTPELAPIIGHQDTVRRAAPKLFFKLFFSSSRLPPPRVCLLAASDYVPPDCAVPQIQAECKPSTQRSRAQRPLPLGHGIQVHPGPRSSVCAFVFLDPPPVVTRFVMQIQGQRRLRSAEVVAVQEPPAEGGGSGIEAERDEGVSQDSVGTSVKPRALLMVLFFNIAQQNRFMFFWRDGPIMIGRHPAQQNKKRS